MRKLLFIVCFLMLMTSCKIKQAGRDEDILTAVYKNQKFHYDQKMINKDEYKSIIDFSAKRRREIYRRNNIKLTSQDFIILEGYSVGWGKYLGVLISNSGSYTYTTDSSGNYAVEPVNIESKDIETLTGIRRIIIDKIKSWDTLYINEEEKKMGNYVQDGYVFMATRVEHINTHKVEIKTISFIEFAY